MNYYELLNVFLVAFSIVLAILYGKGFGRNNRAFKIFAVYLMFIAVIQVITTALAWLKIYNIYFFHFYFILQFICLSLFFKELLNYRWVLWIMGAICLLLALYYINDPSVFFVYHPVGVTVTQGTLVLYALLYFYKSLSYNNEFIYVNTGILIYLFTSILFFAAGNFLMDLIPMEVQKKMGYVNAFLYLLFMVLIFIEWYKNYRKPKDISV